MRNLPDKPRRRLVDFFSEPMDFRCAMLAGLGFSTECITQDTGLTKCQVIYRLKKADIKRAAYRNGNSPMAQNIMHRAKSLSAAAVTEHLKKHLE